MTSGTQPPTPYQWQVGDVFSAALGNAQLYTGLTFLLNPPIFEAHQTATFNNVTSTMGSWTPISFADSAGIDTDSYNGHSTTTNPSRYVAQVPGWYWISGEVNWAVNATGVRGARMAVNGTAVPGTGMITAAVSGFATAVATGVRKVYLNGTTDYVELHGAQNSGASLSTATGGDLCTMISVSWAHA